MTNAEIAREYRDKYGPEMPTHQLARIMYQQYPLIWKDTESARHCLRYIEGKNGSKNKKHVSDTSYFMEKSRTLNPYKLPSSYASVRKPFPLPKSITSILLLSDIHIPYHDIKAVTAAIDYGKESEVNCVFINGDLIDFHRISKHESDLRKRSTKEEFEAADEFLATLRKEFPEIPIYWLRGNHDNRWDKYLQQKATEIWDDHYFRLEERLGLNQKQITMISDKQLVMAGKLMITHGHLLVNSGVAKPAKKAYEKAGQSVIMGHLHTRDYYRKNNAIRTGMGEAWITGCLCEQSPDYNPINDGQHGFAHIKIVNKDGDFSVLNYEIANGKISL
jgi:predicted phosphodiesterase